MIALLEGEPVAAAAPPPRPPSQKETANTLQLQAKLHVLADRFNIPTLKGSTLSTISGILSSAGRKPGAALRKAIAATTIYAFHNLQANHLLTGGAGNAAASTEDMFVPSGANDLLCCLSDYIVWALDTFRADEQVFQKLMMDADFVRILLYRSNPGIRPAWMAAGGAGQDPSPPAANTTTRRPRPPAPGRVLLPSLPLSPPSPSGPPPGYPHSPSHSSTRTTPDSEAPPFLFPFPSFSSPSSPAPLQPTTSTRDRDTTSSVSAALNTLTRLSLKGFTLPSAFFLKFEDLARTACILRPSTDLDSPSTQIAGKLREKIAAHAPRTGITAATRIDDWSYNRMKAFLTLQWPSWDRDQYADSPGPGPAAAAAAARSPTPSNPTPTPTPTTSSTTAAPATANPNFIKRRCGLTCSYEIPPPAVPQEFRGALYKKAGLEESELRTICARNRRCRAAAVCEACRRPRAQHPSGRIRSVRAFSDDEDY